MLCSAIRLTARWHLLSTSQSLGAVTAVIMGLRAWRRCALRRLVYETLMENPSMVDWMQYPYERILYIEIIGREQGCDEVFGEMNAARAAILRPAWRRVPTRR